MDLYAGKEGRVGYYGMDSNFRSLGGLNSGGCVGLGSGLCLEFYSNDS